MTSGRRLNANETEMYTLKGFSTFTMTMIQQVAQLSQRNRAAGWVTFWWVVGDGVGQSGANVVGSIYTFARGVLRAHMDFYVRTYIWNQQRLLLTDPRHHPPPTKK